MTPRYDVPTRAGMTVKAEPGRLWMELHEEEEWAEIEIPAIYVTPLILDLIKGVGVAYGSEALRELAQGLGR